MLEYLRNLAIPTTDKTATKHIILITGGAGFLAQHLIKEIQTFFPEIVAEIRTLDRKIFSKFLDYDDKIPLKHHQGECTDREMVLACLEGVDSVFHLAGKCYDFNIYPNRRHFNRDNLLSTQVLIECMKEKNVGKLVLVSDAMAHIEWNDNCMMSMEIRSQAPPPSGHWLLGPYGETKFKAEQLVLATDGYNTQNGSKLRTIVVRPPFMYGEGDTSLIPALLHRAGANCGVLTQIGDGKGSFAHYNRCQFVYVGNCANMMADLWRQLASDPEKFGGEMFFCTDGIGASIRNVYDLARPFLENQGFRISKQAYSYESAMLLAFFGEKALRLASTVTRRKIGESFPTLATVRIAGGLNFLFNTTKARLLFEWRPAYEPEASMKHTVEWFKDNYAQPV